MLSRLILQKTDKPRESFSAGIGSYISNLAVVLAGKVPVNLNFTLGPASVEACIRKADIDCVLTARAVKSKMPGTWPETGLIDVVLELQARQSQTLALRCDLHCAVQVWPSG